MSFPHRYQQTGADSDDEDEDLTLEELDPLPSENKSTYRSTFGRRQNNSTISLHSLKPTGTRGSNGKGKDKDDLDRRKVDDEEDARGLLDGDQQARGSSGSMSLGQDDAPLLQSGPSHPHSKRKLFRRRSSNGEKISRFLSKLRSTPRSEVEGEYDPASTRNITVGFPRSTKFPPNTVSNAKYTPWSFLPRTLYNEFSFFFNMYFLLVALSQVIPPLRIGYLSTYIFPLAFVLVITLGKEAIDDIARRRRDAEANSERYTTLAFEGDIPLGASKKRSRTEKSKSNSFDRVDDIGEEEHQANGNGEASQPFKIRELVKMSRDLKVGDVLQLEKDQRVPADAIILKTFTNDQSSSSSDDSGEAFIRTDQLDGETDWKLRLAPGLSQQLNTSQLPRLSINASKPDKKVNEFVGNLTWTAVGPSTSSSSAASIPLTIDNTAWANTVLASNATVLAVVVYTGPQTRQAMSTAASRTKTGLLEYEINALTKILCILTFLLSFLLVAIERFEVEDGGKWYVAVMRFLILFSTIIPISLRVNVDMAKSVYAWFIHRDKDIPDTVVRTSTIPEDLGRIEYLLSDKTGTLTQNDMQLRKIHVGTVSYANEAMSEVSTYVRQAFAPSEVENAAKGIVSASSATRSRREIGSRVRDLVLALALCHNVTPTIAEENGEIVTTYQASSPDEIAILRWTESVGLRLAHRDRHSMKLESTHSGQVVMKADILNLFPFTSDGKRMGIVVRFTEAGTDGEHPIWFFQKGADTVMSSIVASNDWLDEETSNMAREGLRTLVVGRKRLSSQAYQEFTNRYKEASVSLQDRDSTMAEVVKKYLEQDLELLGVTGVEDKLQHDVKPSLELLRNAGIKIWMLTGDKVETARCVSISSRLVARGQYIHTIAKLTSKDLARDSLDFLRSKPDACLLIDGDSLALMLTHYREDFIATAVRLSAVVACRCSPTQKAEVALLIGKFTKKRICCIGDGGNDVSMIQAADVGVGIVGKEGKQASLAADFSITQFSYLTKLLVWHGRNSYKRSAKLAQFVIHRGLIISVCQTIYSIAHHSEPIALYKDWLLVGYATVYTMMPVFSLTLDTDIPPQLAHLYPELYAELSSSRSLSYRTFFVWVAISIYQGCAIQILSQLIVPSTPPSAIPTTGSDVPGMPADPANPIHALVDPRMLSVSYTVLIINELVMVAAEVTTWHWIMVATIVGTAFLYFGTMPFLGAYFDLAWLLKLGFWWRVAAIAAVSLVPVYAMKIVRRCVRPPNYRKVQQGL